MSTARETITLILLVLALLGTSAHLLLVLLELWQHLQH
jgi:hypothetical protein